MTVGRFLLLIYLNLFLTGCKPAPVPPEVREAEIQEHDLWRAGAEIYAAEEYRQYKIALRNGKDHLIKENKRFVWFRDYEAIKKEFSDVLFHGRKIFKKIDEQKQAKSNIILSQINYFQDRIITLKKLSSLIHEGRLSRRSLTKAEVLLNETKQLHEKGKYLEAEARLNAIDGCLTLARAVISPILDRYSSIPQITKWRIWVDDTIERSRGKGTYCIIVSKADKKLTLYKNGIHYKTYPVGIGKNGYTDKLYAGDKATPEGKYYIIKKKAKSRFYKALLINYPNEDDKRQFTIAKKNGIISQRVGIGGLIEIHGGGKDGMTDGCISLENAHIDELFQLVDVGTPVTIVGATEYSNSISNTIKEL